jgi:hypothetical protein
MAIIGSVDNMKRVCGILAESFFGFSEISKNFYAIIV